MSDEKVWGVRNVTLGNWVCLEIGDAASDEPWRSHRKRAEQVCERMRGLYPGFDYRVMAYVASVPRTVYG